MERHEDFDITIDSSFLATFQSLPMEMYKVFREFIDNSLQSYLDNKEALDSLQDSPKKCVVDIRWDANEISVVDNSFGMDREAFGRALKLSKQSPRANENDRLSRFGMGLKTAACYASSDFIIESVAYGSGVCYYTEMDIDSIKLFSPKTNPVIITDCLKAKHGTRLLLKRINPNCSFTRTSYDKVLAKLSRIYYVAIQKGVLAISINKVPVKIVDPDLYKDSDPKRNWNGNEVYAAFGNDKGFSFGGKKYRYEGWAGMLSKSKANGETTGFDFFQADRAIVLGDHPSALFGPHNDARFQRVFGQITLLGNEWPISFNKDQIQWGDQGLLEAFVQDLQKHADLLRVFSTAKNVKLREKHPSPDPKVPEPAINDDSSTSEGLTENGGDCSRDSANSGTAITVTPHEYESRATLTYKDYTYEFVIKTKNGERGDDWVKLISFTNEKHIIKANIEMNRQAAYFSDIMNTKAIYKFAQLYIAARIHASINGLPLNQSLTFENCLNDIVRNGR